MKQFYVEEFIISRI